MSAADRQIDWRPSAATMSLDFPTVQVTPVRESDKAQQNATLREHWTVEVLKRDPRHSVCARVDELTVELGHPSKEKKLRSFSPRSERVSRGRRWPVASGDLESVSRRS